MNLLFAVDDNYVDQLLTTLYSVYDNSRQTQLDIYILQSQPLTQNDRITAFCQRIGATYHPVLIAADAFDDAPTTDRYPKTIYYRLLAHEYLPQDLDKILYMDADILCLNPIQDLYDMDLGDKLYAAASHVSDDNVLDLVNKLRLQNFEMESYFNTGTLLMNLAAIRQTVKRQDIMDYIAANASALILPDQDVLNGLYGHYTLEVPDEIYNYDARYSLLYQARNRDWDLDWVVANTVFLHFCGRAKPWLPDYNSRYAGLFKHYQHKARLLEG